MCATKHPKKRQRQRQRRKTSVREFSSRVPAPPARVPSDRPKETTQRNADPSGGRVRSERRDGHSSALAASVARVARRRSVRSACTFGISELACTALAERPISLRSDQSESDPRGAAAYLI